MKTKMRQNKRSKHESFSEFETEDLKEEKRLVGFTAEEKKMIKLMSSIFVKHIMETKSVILDNNEQPLNRS